MTYEYYDGQCDTCHSENCGQLAGLPECIWEAAKQAEEEMAKDKDKIRLIEEVAFKYNVAPQFISAILEEFEDE